MFGKAALLTTAGMAGPIEEYMYHLPVHIMELR
jgi:hypothetical protein